MLKLQAKPFKKSTWSRLIILTLIASLPLGCGQAKVSPTTYELTKALYSVCSRQDTAHLQRFTEELEKQAEAKSITNQEQSQLQSIVEQATNQKWESALRSCRDILENQTNH